MSVYSDVFKETQNIDYVTNRLKGLSRSFMDIGNEIMSTELYELSKMLDIHSKNILKHISDDTDKQYNEMNKTTANILSSLVNKDKE